MTYSRTLEVRSAGICAVCGQEQLVRKELEVDAGTGLRIGVWVDAGTGLRIRVRRYADCGCGLIELEDDGTTVVP